MLIAAPIFKEDYISKQTEGHSRDNIKGNVQNKSVETSSSTYNIFKTAINRGTELIRSTFLSKNNNFCIDSKSGSSVNNICQSLSLKLNQSEQEKRTFSSSSESSDSDDSSPDSIKKELMLFKPIAREPRTLSAMTNILQIPSVRSTSSNSTIQTPCPSPFFIPITSQRQSAFSFVRAHTTTENENQLKKPKSVKRKKSNAENKKSLESSPKRKRSDRKKVDGKKDIKSIDLRKTRGKTEKLIETREIKTRQQSNILLANTTKKEQKTKTKATLNGNINHKKSNGEDIEYRRITRSMKN